MKKIFFSLTSVHSNSDVLVKLLFSRPKTLCTNKKKDQGLPEHALGRHVNVHL